MTRCRNSSLYVIKIVISYYTCYIITNQPYINHKSYAANILAVSLSISKTSNSLFITFNYGATSHFTMTDVPAYNISIKGKRYEYAYLMAILLSLSIHAILIFNIYQWRHTNGTPYLSFKSSSYP